MPFNSVFLAVVQLLAHLADQLLGRVQFSIDDHASHLLAHRRSRESKLVRIGSKAIAMNRTVNFGQNETQFPATRYGDIVDISGVMKISRSHMLFADLDDLLVQRQCREVG